MIRSFIVFVILFLLLSCQAAKDGLVGKKRTNADEFLVEKKNPLVLPPKFGDLPSPGQTIDNKETNDIEDLLTSSGSEQNNEDLKINSDIENIILKEIRE
tara:strand:+ start:1062 stop:1361 length:300 start_codon:yes stop_codon:yes gene_type:complete